MNSVLEKFQKLAEEAEIGKATLRSKEAYMKLARNQREIRSIQNLNRGLESVGRMQIGQLVTFEYEAKSADELPYWDRFPLVYITKVHRDGWTGMNLHYLHPRMRARLFYEMDSRNINIIDNDLSNLCTKRYLADHVVVEPRKFPKDLWEIAIQLPFENFENKTNNYVWRQTSMKKKK